MSVSYLGLVTLKKYCHSDESTVHRMMTGNPPSGMPSVIEPEGLSLQRRKYLAKEIREFCTPATRDLVCPIPGRHKFSSWLKLAGYFLQLMLFFKCSRMILTIF